MSAPGLFRARALARLATPEDLDQRIRIVPPLGWAALLVCAAALAGALAWGIFGTYRMTAAGQGILVREGGLFVAVHAPKAGWLDHLAAIGDGIAAGDLIARLRAPEEDARVVGLEERIQELRTQREAVRARFAERLSQEQQATATRRKGLEEIAALTARRIVELETMLRARETLAGGGLATVERVIEARERLFAAREALARTRADLATLDASLLSLQSQRDAELESLSRQGIDVHSQLEQARLSRDLATEIRAGMAGEVVMAPVTRFSLVSAGQRLLVVETGEDTLEALVFIPAEAGKQVRPGMEVRLSPTTARREEYGALLGTVASVSPVPMTQQEVADLISNPDLARQFAGERAPVLVRARLHRDASAGANAYAWTSRKGREVEVDNGMLVTADAAPMVRTVSVAAARPRNVRRARTPTILQMEAAECGAACLAMVLAHHGRWVPLEELRSACGVSRDGSRASNLVRAARTHGLEAKGWRVEPEALADHPMPAIAFWEFNHFVVVEGRGRKGVWLNDPASGPRLVSHAEFDDAFTGVLLTFRPTPAFAPGGQPPRPWASALSRLAAARSALLFLVLTATLALLPVVAVPAASKVFVDEVLVRGLEGWLRPLLLGLLLAALLRGALAGLQEHVMARQQLALGAGFGMRFFRHMLRLPVGFFAQRYAGDLAARASAASDAGHHLGVEVTGVVASVLGVLFYLGLMLLYDPVLTSVGAGIAIANALVMQAVARSQRDGTRRVLREANRLAAVSVGGIQSIETLKAAGLESAFFGRWAGLQARLLNARLQLPAGSVSV